MRLAEDAYDVGVIVGRFQVPELHVAHKALINAVCERHGKVVMFLGLSPLRNTTNNPLDFEARKQMILEQYPDINVLYIKDVHNDELWSTTLDGMIEDVAGGQSVVLYGGRDSFIKHYTGRNHTQEFEQDVFMSGTEIRKSVFKKSTHKDPAFRAGVIWASQTRFPTVYTTVDVAVLSDDGNKILLARKANEDKYRLIGGFSDPRSASFEDDARREVREEAQIEITDVEYVGSFNVDDWRYRGEVDNIRTMLYTARIESGTPAPADDIVEVKWFTVGKDTLETIMPLHRDLVQAALAV